MDDIYLNKVKNGDYNAFRYFVKTYAEKAFGIAISILKNQEDAEDVLQEAFIKAFKSIKSYKGNAVFSTWFIRIVINEALKLVQKRNFNEKKLHELSKQDEENTMNSINSLHVEEQSKFIKKAMQRMPPNEAVVLNLFYLEENSVEEIKNITGWTVANIKVILYRGRKRLYHIINGLLQSETKSILQNEI